MRTEDARTTSVAIATRTSAKRRMKKEGPRCRGPSYYRRGSDQKLIFAPTRIVRGSVNARPFFRNEGFVAVARGFVNCCVGFVMSPAGLVIRPPSPLQMASGIPAHG